MTKHERKLKKKALRLIKAIEAHENFAGWEKVSYKIASNKIKLYLSGCNRMGDPWGKKVELGLKTQLNIDRFTGKFYGV